MKLGSCVKKVTKIAITGKIGSGKTSLCNIIKKIGYKVYESDKEVEKLLKRAQIIEKVKLLYKGKIRNLIDNNGNINKKIIGNFLFSNKNELDKLEKIKVENLHNHQTTWLDLKGLFIYVGRIPSEETCRFGVALDEEGFILTDDYMRTDVPGIYAAGDIRSKQIRQIQPAIADGMIAAVNIGKIIAC